MIAHIVLFRPRRDLDEDQRRAFAQAFARAIRDIPSVRRAHVGRRRALGTAYDTLMVEDFPYAAVIEFDDEKGLREYLGHPAHVELGDRFYRTIEAGLTYDFEMRAAGDAETLLE